MEILYKSKYYLIGYEEDNELIYYYHPPETVDITPDKYLQELQVFIKHALEYRPKVGLGDLRDFNFIITPYIQEWIDENLFPVMQEIALQKHAILLTPEFIVQLSVKQAIDESTEASIKTRYFPGEPEAREWLLV